MKLARIVLPMLDNDGRDLYSVHRTLQQMLLVTFGGFTSYEGLGGWVGKHKKLYHERVAIYDIAMERAAVTKLREIAQEICAAARQESVMIVTPNGDAEFLHAPLDEPVAASV